MQVRYHSHLDLDVTIDTFARRHPRKMKLESIFVNSVIIFIVTTLILKINCLKLVASSYWWHPTSPSYRFSQFSLNNSVFSSIFLYGKVKVCSWLTIIPYQIDFCSFVIGRVDCFTRTVSFIHVSMLGEWTGRYVITISFITCINVMSESVILQIGLICGVSSRKQR
jgi:hypothetical protein